MYRILIFYCSNSTIPQFLNLSIDSIFSCNPASVAQLDRALASEAKGFGFESRRVYNPMPDGKTKYYVYVLRSLKDQNYYYGLTTNIESRLDDHNAGRVISTKPRRPLELVYFEELFGYTNARRREKYFKSSAGRKFLSKKLLQPKVSGSPPA